MKKLNVTFFLVLITLFTFGTIVESIGATVLKDLKVEYLKNPVGIDVSNPRFSWKMESTVRGAAQAAYQIIVSIDRDGGNTVWDSGKIDSDKSVHIKYGGNTLSPMTRYYWHVSVWDNNNSEIISTETAYFETGLMKTGWSNAKWLKAPSLIEASETEWLNITKYSLEMDFEIDSESVGPIFGATDERNFYMWQINIGKETNKTYLRPHSWQNGNPVCHAEIDITTKKNVQKGTVYKLKIEIDGKIAKTYIDDILVNEMQNPFNRDYGFGKIGFRANKGNADENGYFDNIKVIIEKNGENETVFSEDFSQPSNLHFTYGVIENERLFVKGGISMPIAWQKAQSANPVKFDLSMKMTVVSHGGGIIFSAQNTKSFYMWSVLVTDNNDNPTLRRHYFNGGSPSSSDVNIGNYIKKSQLINKEISIKIEVDNNVVKTYINNTLVDTYADGYGFLISGNIGFRAYKGNNSDEVVIYDDIIYTEYIDNQPVVKLSEDFDSDNTLFEGGEIVNIDGNAKLKVFSHSDATLLFDATLSEIDMFRTEFTLTKQISSAKIYSSALGVYDLFINGERVGHVSEGDNIVYDEFKPGWTDYTKTVFYSTYDVSSYIQQGQNVIGAHVSSGWWQGNIAHGKYGNVPLAFIAKLVIEYEDGTSEIIVSNTDDWLTSKEGPIKLGDIYNGESYDARKESDWTKFGFNTSTWKPTVLSNDFKGEIKAFVGPPVRVRPELQQLPVKITKYEGISKDGTTYGSINIKETYNSQSVISLKKGETAVYDMGQNMVGWVKFKVKGNSGTKMKIRFAEMLNDTGEASRANDDAGGTLYTAALRGARATLYYTLKGSSEGEVFNPSMTFFGFRYCDVIATEDIEIEWLTGEVVGTIAEEGSELSTSNPLINQLYSNIMWGQRGNFLSIPTDCPQRDERLGWTGDIQIFGHAAIYNADLSAFFHKWMGDMRDSQRSDGAYPDVAPHAWVGWGQAAWADAGIVIPWIVYLMYDNIGILEENYKSMEDYMNFLKAQAGDGYQYNGAGTNYGDWVAPVSTDRRYVSVCYYAYTALLMEKVSQALSKTANDSYAVKAKSYRLLYDKIKTEFQERYVYANGTLKEKTQTAYLLALKLDLLPSQDSRTKIISALRTLILTNANRLNTGFIGTGIINQTLSEVGLTDLAYNLLLQRNNPSWLYSVDQGATTIWERWDSYKKESGFNPSIGMNSFNHYAYGAVSEWMYRYMAGINPDENNVGFKHINFTPNPDFRTSFPAQQERITSVDATYDSYYGKVKSAWQIQSDGSVKYSIVVPANTTATVILPLNLENSEVLEGNKPLSETDGVISFKVEDTNVTIDLKSGSYVFSVARKNESSIRPTKKESNLHVYPNPVHDKLNIYSDTNIERTELYNIYGMKIYSANNVNAIAMNFLPDGIYYLFVDMETHDEIVKIIKK